MAAQEILVSSSASLKLLAGSVDGKTVTKSVAIPGLVEEPSNDALLAVANAIVPCMAYKTSAGVYKTVRYQIEAE